MTDSAASPVLSDQELDKLYGNWCCLPDSGDCCGPGSWCCARAGNHSHPELVNTEQPVPWTAEELAATRREAKATAAWLAGLDNTDSPVTP